MSKQKLLISKRLTGSKFIEKLKLFTIGLIAGMLLTRFVEDSKLQGSLLSS